MVVVVMVMMMMMLVPSFKLFHFDMLVLQGTRSFANGVKIFGLPKVGSNLFTLLNISLTLLSTGDL